MSSAAIVRNMPYLATMPSCVFYLRATGLSGNTIFRDWSRLRNTVSIGAGSPVNSSTVKFPPASISLPGSAYLQTPSFTNCVSATSPFMVSFWMKSSTVPSGYGGVLAQDYVTSPPNGAWRIGTFFNGGGNLGFHYTNSGYVDLTSGYNPNDGNWHFVQVFRNATNYSPNNTINIYVDNISKLSSAIGSGVSLGVNGNYITIGWESQDNRYYIGNLDELAFWNGALGTIPTQTAVYTAATRRLIVG